MVLPCDPILAMNTIGMQSPSSYFLQSLPAAGPRSYCLPRIVLRSPSSSALSRPVRPLASLRWIDHRRLHDANEGNDSCSQQLVRTLLIDNYDSYTYNIYQELAVVNGGLLSIFSILFVLVYMCLVCEKMKNLFTALLKE
ncbi:hypothetical protein HPP92_010397 [Vanilla planifolia]|uniref:Uncharacterized protein n=1 Tax=Vanilla planifolia TaxID=51239 RepID=A0A835QVK8_VANPL|nr:hypothetical protein HPP92_010397 [Vanilla planifolia]